jgi:hypothetical protein
LKQLQLNKILRIKLWRAVNVALAAIKARRINSRPAGQSIEKAASGNAETAF